MKIGVLVAMDCEYEQLARLGLEAPGKEVALRVTGIGKVNAAMSATEMIIKQKPDCIVNSGCAGGMSPGQKVGDFVIGSSTAYHDVWCGEPNSVGQVHGCPETFKADPHMCETAIEVARKYSCPVQVGMICTGDQFFISTEEDERIRRVHPGVLAADMESAAIAQVCDAYRIPFISLRIISDIHTSDDVQKETYKNFWSESQTRRFQFLKEFIKEI